MTWVFIVSQFIAIGGYKTEADCHGALQAARKIYVEYYLACIPAPEHPDIVMGRR